VTVPKLRFGLLLVVLAVLVAPGTASAALSVGVQSTTVSEAGSPRNGVIEGGDTVAISVHLLNGASAATGVSATLNSTDPAMVVGTSAYPDLAPFATAVNTTPFLVQLPADVLCGQAVAFTLDVSSGAETVTVPVTIATGGPATSFDQYDQQTPFALPNPLPTLQHFLALAGGSARATSNLRIVSAGYVKDIHVRLGQLDGPHLGNLVVTLVPPDGPPVVLLDHRGAGSTHLIGTVFRSDGGFLDDGAPPFTGSFKPEHDDLSALIGRQVNGTWKLQIDMDDSTEFGQMAGWGLDIKGADCTARSHAALTVAPAQITPGATATLDASDSVDTVGTDPHYFFDLDDDGTFEVDNGSSPVLANQVFATHGRKHLHVRLYDGTDLIDTATADVAVSQVPTAVISPSAPQPLSGDVVHFLGTGSTDVETLPANLVHAWSVDGGPYTTGDSPTFDKSFPKQGTHVVRLRVTDEDGASAIAAVSVDVQNRLPSASVAVTAPPAVAGRATTFDASLSDDLDGTIVDYAWDLDDNGSFETHTTDPTASKTFASRGDQSIHLQVTDDDGGVSGVVDLLVAVTDAPVLGAFTADQQHPRPGATVTFTLASAVDPDGGAPLTYSWSFDGGATSSSGGLAKAHLFATAGTVDVTVTATDDEGASTTATLALVVSGLPPVAVLTATPNPVMIGAAVHFDASGSSDPDSSIAGYAWDLDGDSAFETVTGATPTVTATYPNPGLLTVSVQVTDDDGHHTVATLNLTIQAPASAPGGNGGAGAGGSSASPDDGGLGAGSPGHTGAGSGSAGTSAGGDRATQAERFTAVLAGSSIQTLKAVLKGGVSVACDTSSAARCTLRVELSASDARRLGLSHSRSKKAFVLARATVRTDGSRAHKVALKLTPGTVAKLRRVGRMTIAVTGQAVDDAGHTASIKRSVLVRNR
jgi:subtilisin-like proprotein convertase family protein